MDADLVRLLLFLAGIALIIGIFLWDRRKKAGVRIHAIRKLKSVVPAANPKAEAEQRKEPIWDDEIQSEDDSGHVVGDVLEQLDDLIQDEAQAGANPEQTSFSFAAEPRQGAPMSDVALPSKILQLNLVARQGNLRGDDILRATAKVAMQAGDMSIFHRYAQGQALFSMASLVEPGNFPLADMTEFETPGLVLFARLPAQQDGLSVFSQMLEAAQTLGAELGAELQDETHSDLSRQTIDHIREEIQEYNRQLQLAKSRI